MNPFASLNPSRLFGSSFKHYSHFNPCWMCVLLVVLFVLSGCSKSKPTEEGAQANKSGSSVKKPNQQKTDSGDSLTEKKDDSKSNGTTDSKNQDNKAKDTVVTPYVPLKQLMAMEVGYTSLNAIAFAQDGQTFVTCGDTPMVWRFGGKEPIHEFEGIYPLTGRIFEPEAVAITDDGKVLAFAGGNGMIYVFNFATYEAIHEIQASEQGIVSLSFSRDGKKLASSGYDGKAKIWNVDSGDLIATIETPDQRRLRSALTPDGLVLATAGNEADTWDASTGKKIGNLNIGEARQVGTWYVDISRDGAKIVTGDATKDFENAAMIWSTESRKLEATLKHEFGVLIVKFAPNGNWLATVDVNGVVRIWRLADKQLVQTIEPEEFASVDTIQWTPDSKMLAISGDGTLRFWGQPGSIKSTAEQPGNDEQGTEKTEHELEEDTEGPPDENATDKTHKSEEASPVKQNTIDQNKAPTVAFDSVIPMTVTEASKTFIAKEFPAPFDAAPDLYSSSTESGYSVRKPFEQVIEELEKTFDELEWELISRDLQAEKNIAYGLRNGDLFISCKAREDRPSVVRIDLAVLGNVDIRSIPKLDPSKVSFDLLDYSVYETNASHDQIKRHYDKHLISAGWVPYREFDSQIEDSDQWRMTKYRNAGVKLNISALTRNGITFASIFCEMLEQDVPVPEEVSDYELDDHLFRQRFKSTKSVDELTEFFNGQMEKYGWSIIHGKSFDSRVSGMLFTRPDRDPVYLELWKNEDGATECYMAVPTRQVTRAAKGEFEVEYEKGMPLGESQMHTLDYRSIPFNEPLKEGSGRSIAEAVFCNNRKSIEENIEFYRDWFTNQGWTAGDRKDEMIGDSLQRAIVNFKKGDATIEMTIRPWVKETNRVVFEGNGIFFPGARFCQMMARDDEATNIE